MTRFAPILVGGRPLPRDLRRGVEAARQTQDEESLALLAWAEALPGHVDRVTAQWGLELGAPLEPGGTSAWVAEVRDASGGELLLKVGWAHEEARDEAAGLAHWQGHGAVRLDRHERSGDCSALLMERVRPGRTLSASLPEKDRDHVVAALLRALWAAPEADVAAFRPLSAMCADWADGAAARLEGDLESALLPAEVQERGLHLMRTLPLTWDGPQPLLATDLHHHNVLSRAPDPGTDLRDWALIDPKPYLGDPHYDLLQHMLNFRERLLADPLAFAQRMARLTDLDPQRTVTWLFARCVQETGVMDGARETALFLDGHAGD